jgi:hypothetical protein
MMSLFKGVMSIIFFPMFVFGLKAQPAIIKGQSISVTKYPFFATLYVEMPQNYAAVSATAMLFGNFCDACIAVVDVTFSGTKDVTLSFDAHTLGVIAPRYYSVKRAHIPGSVPCTDYYAVSAPDRPDRAWATSAEDGKLAPSVLWAVQNALNCSFPGSAAEGKTLMRQWLTGLGKRFIGACAERSITRAELAAIAANRLSTAS